MYIQIEKKWHFIFWYLSWLELITLIVILPRLCPHKMQRLLWCKLLYRAKVASMTSITPVIDAPVGARQKESIVRQWEWEGSGGRAHWAKIGLDFPFWWTSQNCIFMILGYSWPFLNGKSTLRFFMKYFEMSEKLLGSWWKLEIF